MRWLHRISLVLILLLATTALAQDDSPDSDGDGTPDTFDSCPTAAGAPENSGCPEGIIPDLDGDGVPDMEDLCFDEPGEAALLGCTAASFPDFDGDTVADLFDACFDQAGDPANSGCPAGITPDLDGDGIPDAQDNCPTEFGDAANNGCLPDADGDGIPDVGDACPNEAGSTANYGCAAAGGAPDSDGDTVPDLFDTCPQTAGLTTLSGCPDSDGDLLPDPFDACPQQPGTQELLGCPAVESATLPTNRTPITSANAAGVAPLSALTLRTPSIAVADNGRLAVRGSNRVLVYDLNAAQLTPLAEAPVTLDGSPIALSSSGQYLATTDFPPAFDGPSFVEIRDGATAQPIATVNARQRDIGRDSGVGRIAFSPVAPLLAVIEDAGMGYNSGFNSFVGFFDVTTGTRTGEISLTDAAMHVVFSPDGSQIAVDPSNGQALEIEIWDVESGLPVVEFETTPLVHFMGTPMQFMPAGDAIAFGKPDGTVTVRDLTTNSDRFTAPLFDGEAGEVVSALAVSPDGSVIAAAGGPGFSGGLTGSETFPIVLLDAATGAELSRIDTTESLINEMTFSPDGTLLITGAAVNVQFYGVGGS